MKIYIHIIIFVINSVLKYKNIYRIQKKCPLARRSVNSIKWELALDFDFFLPFELISIILLVALIGAIAVARQ